MHALILFPHSCFSSLLPSSEDGEVLVQLIVLLSNPSGHLALSADDPEATTQPQRCQCCTNAIDSIPPPLPDQRPVLLSILNLTRRKAEPLRRTPNKMPHTDTNERGEASERNRRMQSKSMGNVFQADKRRIAMCIQRQYPRGPDMESTQRHQRISQRTSPADDRPRYRAFIAPCLRAIPQQRLSSAPQPQRDSRRDVCDQGQSDEQGFRERGLIVWPGEEQVAITFYD